MATSSGNAENPEFPPFSFFFTVSIGNEEIAFQEVGGLDAEVETEEIG